MRIPKETCKKVSFAVDLLLNIEEGKLAERLVTAMDEKPGGEDRVRIAGGALAKLYSAGFDDGLKEAAHRLSEVIKFGR